MLRSRHGVDPGARYHRHQPSVLWRSLATAVHQVLPFAVALLVWQLSVLWLRLPPVFYPSPAAVMAAFIEVLRNGVLLAYIGDSFVRYAAGCLAGVCIGVPIGLLIGLNRTASAMLMPILNFFQSIVELAWIPLFVLWFGYGFVTIFVSLAYVVAFLVMFSTVQGVRRVPTTTVDAVRVLGARWYHLAFDVMLPGALADIVTGVRLGAGYAFRGLVGAEMIAARSGLGYMLFAAREQDLTTRVVVGMIVIGALWLLLDRVYLRPLERATVERWGMLRVEGGV